MTLSASYRTGLLRLSIALLICGTIASCAHRGDQEESTPPNLPWSPDEHVTQFGPNGSALLPTQQLLTPAGRQIELPKMRPQVLALSPDGRLLATSGMTSELVLLDPKSGKIVQHVPIPPDQSPTTRRAGSSHNLFPQKDPLVSYTGLKFSPDGTRIYLPNVWGSIAVFAVDSKHHVRVMKSIPLPPTGLKYHPRPIPAGLAVSIDGKRLYVAMNVSNQLAEVDIESGKVLRTFDVGTAPFDVVVANHKAYVSNWGGRRVDDGTPTGPIGVGARVRVDPVRYIANEGSVSVIDLDNGRVLKELIVGMHASALAATADGRHVAVANASSDTVSVIETSNDTIVETISARWDPHDLFGASPNALAFDRSGRTLYVCNGTQNSIAVIQFDPGHSRLAGLIPTGWYPGAVAVAAHGSGLYVANIK
ncbi:MAG TPA: beta-propeller fold lactonase family protein, partial [Tepidisphaeraceae bacterium]|nr:beta-propeller fold lactonase family protein [Tepidisphaeraceae bacterium]